MSNEEATPTGLSQRARGGKPAGPPEGVPAGAPGAAPAAPVGTPRDPARAAPDPVEEAGWESFPASDPPVQAGAGIG